MAIASDWYCQARLRTEDLGPLPTSEDSGLFPPQRVWSMATAKRLWTPPGMREWSCMRNRFLATLGAYGLFALLAWFTLDGVLRSAVWVLMGGLALKTWIAFRARW
jgi:hypothetical protein